MQPKNHPEFQFDLTGGHIALDLANTVSRRDDPERRREHLNSYADLISFAVQDKIVSRQHGEELRVSAHNQPAAAARSFRTARAFREVLYQTFAAIAQERAPGPEDIQAINDAAKEAFHHRQLVRVAGSYRWDWQENGTNRFDRILWPIAHAAADLLTSEESKLVRWCEAPDCQWLFLDHSRNHSRRWCDMTSCGNRAKARRHYERTRE